MPKSEGAWIEWIRRRARGGRGVRLGVGDDAAVLDPSGAGELVFASDLVIEGVHFSPTDPWELVGRKALARVLSDLAAMAARPWVALASVAVPGGSDDAVLEALMGGLMRFAESEECVLVGGDLADSPRGVVVDVAAIGVLEGRSPWRRDGARVGDRLFVTGPLGGTRESHHLRFRPRWREALALHEGGQVHAAIDLSDGLAKDLPSLARASGVGASLREDAIPRRRDAEGRPAVLEAALGDGEDFELLLAVDPAVDSAFLTLGARVGLELSEIGRIEPDGLWIEREDGQRVELAPGGFEHWS